MNSIPIEEARLIAQQLLQEALLRLDVSNFIRSDTTYGICEIIGLTLRC